MMRIKLRVLNESNREYTAVRNTKISRSRMSNDFRFGRAVLTTFPEIYDEKLKWFKAGPLSLVLPGWADHLLGQPGKTRTRATFYYGSRGVAMFEWLVTVGFDMRLPSYPIWKVRHFPSLSSTLSGARHENLRHVAWEALNLYFKMHFTKYISNWLEI